MAVILFDKRADFLGRPVILAFLGGTDYSAIADDVPLPISKLIASKRFVTIRGCPPPSRVRPG